jgi:hypothetical protein
MAKLAAIVIAASRRVINFISLSPVVFAFEKPLSAQRDHG